jgi:hypothetical protein
MALLALLLALLALASGNNTTHTPTHRHGCTGYYDDVAHMYLPNLCEDDALAEQIRQWSMPMLPPS